MKFTDGTEINTDGPLCVIEKEDGWYVVGGGSIIPVDSEKKGQELIWKMLADLEPKGGGFCAPREEVRRREGK